MSRYKIINTRDSVLAPFIKDFIKLKRSLGFKAEKIEYGLWAFDTFIKQRGVSEIIISKDIVEEWCARRSNEVVTTWSHRVNSITQLSTYLYNIGYEAYIPHPLRVRRETHIPYIYSDDELNAIFTASDALILRSAMARAALLPVPALIRMLAGTGIRLGEAVELKDTDVNLEMNYLTLRETKNGQERLVPISESLSKVCKQYRTYRSMLPYIHSDTFFVKMDGTKCKVVTFRYWWLIILKKAGIQHLGKQVDPRMHDLRHTFCVKTLAQLARQGKDLYYILPVISMYIGHLSVKSTDKYVRMTSEMFPELLSKTDNICTYIYPDLKNT